MLIKIGELSANLLINPSISQERDQISPLEMIISSYSS